MNPLKIFVALFFLAGIPKIYAGDTLSNRYPRAVLVQLRSEHNRIEAMTKDRNYKDLKEVEHDALEVRKRMILDFSENFNYCPVYYYMDTNAYLIKNKDFHDILMNADGTAVTKPVINFTNDDYIIVYYGYALSQPKQTDVVTDPNQYSYDPDSRPGKGLVILNDEFQQIDHFYKLGYDDTFFRLRKKWYIRYYYASKHFDIEYFPMAKLFQKNFGDRYARHRISPPWLLTK